MLIGVGGTALTSTVRGVSAFTPTSVSGLFLWLKADAGVTADGSNKVSAWTDQSSAGNNFSQSTAANKPTLTASAQNGLPAVVFDGTADYMTAGSISIGPWSMLAVVSKNWTTATYSGIWSHGFLGTSGRGFSTTGGAANAWLTKEFFGIGNGFNNGQTPQLAGPYGALTDNTYHLVSAGVGASCFLRLNRASIIRLSTNSVATTATATLAIGTQSATFVNNFWPGGIAELCLYNSRLADSDVIKLENYLKAKWATP